VTARADDIPTHRYTAALAGEIERAWQDRGTRSTCSGRPTAPAARGGSAHLADRPACSCSTCSRIRAASGCTSGTRSASSHRRVRALQPHGRLQRAARDGLRRVRPPAEQFAVQTGTHPRVTTEANIANMRRQMRALGPIGHDPRRGPLHDRRRLLPVDAVDLPQISTRGTTTKADRGRPDPDSSASSSGNAGDDPDRASVREALRARAAGHVVDAYALLVHREAPCIGVPGLGTGDAAPTKEVNLPTVRSERGNFPGLQADRSKQ
jgi:leucyl-tRNA synthetase